MSEPAWRMAGVHSSIDIVGIRHWGMLHLVGEGGKAACGYALPPKADGWYIPVKRDGEVVRCRRCVQAAER